MREARLEVCDEAEAVCSVRMVVLYAMQELDKTLELFFSPIKCWVVL